MIDELLALLGKEHALIGEIAGIDARLQFSGRDIARIVDEVIGSSPRRRFEFRGLQHARTQYLRGVAGRVEQQRPHLGGDLLEAGGVAPFFRAHDVVGDRVLEKLRSRAAGHGPAIPLKMQLRQVNQTRRTKINAADRGARRARRGMIPGADDQELLVALRGRRPRACNPDSTRAHRADRHRSFR